VTAKFVTIIEDRLTVHYHTFATPPLRYGANLSFGIYLASETPPLRDRAGVPFGIYLAPAAEPLHRTLIAALYGKGPVPRLTARRWAKLIFHGDAQ
jgi:hypothetical protein